MPQARVGHRALPDQLLLHAPEPCGREVPHAESVLVDRLRPQGGRPDPRGEVVALAGLDVLPVVEDGVFPAVAQRVDVAVQPQALVRLVAQVVRPQHDAWLMHFLLAVPAAVVIHDGADGLSLRSGQTGILRLDEPHLEGLGALFLLIVQHRDVGRLFRFARCEREGRAGERVILPAGGCPVPCQPLHRHGLFGRLAQLHRERNRAVALGSGTVGNRDVWNAEPLGDVYRDRSNGDRTVAPAGG